MRTLRVLGWISAPLIAAGALAAGCISSSTPPPDTTTDGGGLDSSIPFDSAPPPTVDAGPGDAGAVDAGPAGTLSSTKLDFGLVNCGTGTASQTYSFTNVGGAPLTWSASVATGSVFSVGGASSGTIAPSESGSIVVNVGNIPTSSTAGTPIAGALMVTTNVPGFTSVQVPLSVTPQGGSFTVSPALAGFGQVQLATGGTPIPVTITNVGNAPVSITLGAPETDAGAADTEFAVTWAGSPTAATLAPGASLSDAGVTFHPIVSGVKSVQAAIQTTDPMCASAASAVAISGTGTAAQVTVGPDPLAFGTITCGASGAALVVTIKNSSPSAVTFTEALKLGASSPYTMTASASSVPGGTLTNPGTATITLTPKPITPPASVTPGAFDDTLTVTPAASAGVTATAIALQESAAGAILAVSMPTTGFGTVDNTSGSLPFTVTNSGNRDAPLTMNVTGTGYSSAFTSSATALGDGGTATGNVTFAATNDAVDDGTFKITTSTALCAATIPASVALTATSAIPVANYSGATVALASTCGAGAGSGGAVAVKNTGNAPLTITSATSASGYFTVTNPGAIQPGDTGNIALTGATLGVGAGYTGGSTLNDTLHFSTNEIGGPTYTVPVTLAVSGANLSFSTGNPATTGCGDTTYSVTNTGNMTAYVIATGTYPEDGDGNAEDGTDVFDFDGTFSTSMAVAVGAIVSDSFGRGSVCGIANPCSFTTTQGFNTTNASGTQSGICAPLPSLTAIISVSTQFTCEDTCC